MHDLSTHRFEATVDWNRTHAATLNARERPRRGFSRAHTVSAAPGLQLPGSAARVFRGDSDRWNPEQLFLAAIAQCHMLSYLFVAERAGVSVQAYTDTASGVITLDADGVGGQFEHITLSPVVTLSHHDDVSQAEGLHDEAHKICFIARSTKAPIEVVPQFVIG